MKLHALTVLLVVCMASLPVLADAPSVTITAPTAPVYVASFPATIPVTVVISHSTSLGDLHVLDLRLAGSSTSLLPQEELGNPFPSGNCGSQMDVAHGVTSCNSSGTSATVTLLLPVAEPGDAVVEISIKHGGGSANLGSDTETVTVFLLSASYPAPPAVANNYINKQPLLKAGSNKIRGCVLNEIAKQHGQLSAYNPAPGPYDTTKIQKDVYAYWTNNCGGTWPSGVPVP